MRRPSHKVLFPRGAGAFCKDCAPSGIWSPGTQASITSRVRALFHNQAFIAVFAVLALRAMLMKLVRRASSMPRVNTLELGRAGGGSAHMSGVKERTAQQPHPDRAAPFGCANP